MKTIVLLTERVALKGIIKNILKDISEEYEIKTFEKTEEILKLDHSTINLVVIDHNIDFSNILKLLTTILKKGLVIPFPVILIQDSFDRNKIITSAKLGVRGYVVYPYKDDQLQEKVLHLLSDQLLAKYKVTEVLNREVSTLNKKNSIKEALSTIVSNKLPGTVVLSPDKSILGYISEKDLLSYMALIVTHTDKMHIADIMIKDVKTIWEFSDLSQALNFLLQNNLRQVPVINTEKKFLGFVTRSQLLSYILEKDLHV